jgi:diacylglycerol O-acyltransferase
MAYTRNELEGAGAAPRTRFNGQVGPHRVFDGVHLHLSDFKNIRNATNKQGSINDIVLATCGGAMRKYLEKHGELPEESLIAMAPISVRSDDQNGTAGNQVSGMFVGIRTDIGNHAERLQAITDGTKNSKALSDAVGAHTMTDYSQFVPSTISGMAARLSSRFGLVNHIAPVFNTVISNVPGPQMPLYANGSKMVANFGLGPLADGLGLFHPVFSYNGGLCISFNACRALMPDPDFYRKCLQDSFDELHLQITGTKTMGLAEMLKTPAKKKPVKNTVKKPAKKTIQAKAAE